jgi:hypothetical protein
VSGKLQFADSGNTAADYRFQNVHDTDEPRDKLSVSAVRDCRRKKQCVGRDGVAEYAGAGPQVGQREGESEVTSDQNRVGPSDRVTHWAFPSVAFSAASICAQDDARQRWSLF